MVRKSLYIVLADLVVKSAQKLIPMNQEQYTPIFLQMSWILYKQQSVHLCSKFIDINDCILSDNGVFLDNLTRTTLQRRYISS